MRFVPNALTITRIVLTPALLALLLTGTLVGRALALALFVLAAISDYLDGQLARRYQVGSRLGRFLDPLADKVLVLGTFATLWWLDAYRWEDLFLVTWWGVGLIALRDVGVTGLRSWAEARGKSLRTLRSAKWKTAAQLTFLIALLVFLTAERLPDPIGAWATAALVTPVPLVLFVFTVAVTVVTGLLYLRFETVPPESPSRPSSTPDAVDEATPATAGRAARSDGHH